MQLSVCPLEQGTDNVTPVRLRILDGRLGLAEHWPIAEPAGGSNPDGLVAGGRDGPVVDVTEGCGGVGEAVAFVLSLSRDIDLCRRSRPRQLKRHWKNLPKRSKSRRNQQFCCSKACWQCGCESD